MSKFQFYWENCAMESGRTLISAPTQKDAEAQFKLYYGIDYIVVCIVKLDKK
jgi:hypothetical protein